MNRPDQPTRIAELKARWEADPTSRVFVQLAEEYRRQGQTDDAIAVLERGLANQPNYVSALVALGRCRLDGGDASAAVEVLSRVTEQDPSHPLAGKLLVEAHLQTGELDEAARRLDLYRMMADSDPEIEELERRLGEARGSEPAEASDASAADEPPRAEEPASDLLDLQDLELSFEGSEGAVSTARTPSTADGEGADGAVGARIPASRGGGAAGGDDSGGDDSGGDDIFDLGSAEPALPQRGPFDLSDEPTAAGKAGDEVSLSTPAGQPFELSPPPTASPGTDAPEASEAGAGEPFGDLFGEADLQRLSKGLGGEGIFDLGTAEGEPATIQDSPAAADSLAAAGPADPEPVAPEPGGPAEALAGRHVAERSREMAGDPSGEDAEEATVTLGQLYMAQGHRAEAVRIFRSILQRDPDNEISRKALAQLEAEEIGESVAGVDRGPELRAVETVAAKREGPVVGEPVIAEPVVGVPESQSTPEPRSPGRRQERQGGVTGRKIAMLEDYLKRLRRATGT